MKKFREMNNYIEDVPMKFSDKFLSLQIKKSLFEDDNNENFTKFQIEDYKFDAELSAIEMFELYQKKKFDQLNSTNHSSLKNLKINNISNDYTAPQNHLIINNSTNSLFCNIISGEILKPQPLSENTINTSVHLNRDNINCDNFKNNFNVQHTKDNFVNPKEFENDDSSPFDNVELQTIDDIQELNDIFKMMSSKSENYRSNSTNSQANNVNSNYSTVNNSQLSSQMFYTNASLPSFHVPMSSCNEQLSHTEFYKKNADSLNTISYQANIDEVNIRSNQYNPNNSSHFLHNSPPTNHNNYNNRTNLVHSQCNPFIQYEMKRSSSEKKDLSQNDLSSQNFNLNHNLRFSKSVSDLTQIHNERKSNENLFTTNNLPINSNGNQVTNNSIDQVKDNKPNSNGVLLKDPYDLLSNDEKEYVDNLCNMGFQRDRISRAVQHLNYKSEKKIFEFLLAVQQLEDQGYDCNDIEIALHMNDYDKVKAENFLKVLKQVCECGFNKNESIRALFKSNNDRDRAIELLLNK